MCRVGFFGLGRDFGGWIGFFGFGSGRPVPPRLTCRVGFLDFGSGQHVPLYLACWWVAFFGVGSGFLALGQVGPCLHV
jgi:hypothetical protein